MANCPACKNVVLEPSIIESSLPIMICNSCGGYWLRINEYALWLKSQTPGYFDEQKTREASKLFPVVESGNAVICPDCGRFLRKYRVGSTIGFHLDRCSNCNGVWLDRNEWQSLKMADLHDEINQIFTQPWQQHIQHETTAGKLDAMYLERFGESDYKKIREIREWIQKHPNRNALLAFLMDNDPFST